MQLRNNNENIGLKNYTASMLEDSDSKIQSAAPTPAKNTNLFKRQHTDKFSAEKKSRLVNPTENLTQITSTIQPRNTQKHKHTLKRSETHREQDEGSRERDEISQRRNPH